jgi:transcriptional regulator with XRE-family HTH domain
MSTSKKYPEKQYLEAIGTNIRNLRLKKGLTLEDLGVDIGTDKSNMLRIEQGKNMTILTILKLAIFLEVEPHQLMKVPVSIAMEDMERYVSRKKDKTVKKAKSAKKK